jgi:hypothetical protein
VKSGKDAEGASLMPTGWWRAINMDTRPRVECRRFDQHGAIDRINDNGQEVVIPTVSDDRIVQRRSDPSTARPVDTWASSRRPKRLTRAEPSRVGGREA